MYQIDTTPHKYRTTKNPRPDETKDSRKLKKKLQKLLCQKNKASSCRNVDNEDF